MIRATLLTALLAIPSSAQDEPLRALLRKAEVIPAARPAPEPAARVKLGQLLMFDKLLSSGRNISCATCHHPRFGLSDGLPTSVGAGGTGLGPERTGGSLLGRNAPAIGYLGAVPSLFHDGRVSQGTAGGFLTPASQHLLSGLSGTLAVQALFPLATAGEMIDAEKPFGRVWGELWQRLQAVPVYRNLLAQAYPGQPPGLHQAANALAAYQSQTFSPFDSPFDRYLAGDNGALDPAQKRGALLFYGSARCAECHSGPLLSDHKFHNVGAPQVGPGMGAEAPLDLGRARETGLPQDRFAFRTPILRNVARSGPWTHAGAYHSLHDVVRHYINPRVRLPMYTGAWLESRYQVRVKEQMQAGGLDNLDPIVAGPTPLTPAEVDDLVSFLHALSDDKPVLEIPVRVPSGLPVD